MHDTPASGEGFAHLGHRVEIARTAASAARCATLLTFDVWCDCRLAAAAITSTRAEHPPTRQPVIAYVFATPLSTTQVSANSGTTTGIEVNSCPS